MSLLSFSFIHLEFLIECPNKKPASKIKQINCVHSGDDDEGGPIDAPSGKIGKKKLEKLQAKADKKVAREAEERQREERKKQKEKEVREAEFSPVEYMMIKFILN